jgi:hypothetical protein
LRFGNAVVALHGTSGQTIEEHWLDAVHRHCELRLRCLLQLKLVPQRSKLGCLIRREKAEDSVGRNSFALMLTEAAGDIVGERVTGINFHEVVHDKHS